LQEVKTIGLDGLAFKYISFGPTIADVEKPGKEICNPVSKDDCSP
jgi:hypothetical protein